MRNRKRAISDSARESKQHLEQAAAVDHTKHEDAPPPYSEAICQDEASNAPVTPRTPTSPEEKVASHRREATKGRPTVTPEKATPTRNTPIPLDSSSTWTSLLVGLGTTAGGLSLAVSYEGRRRLKYCISWLQYTIAHTEHHIDILRAMIDDLRNRPSTVVMPVTKQLVQIRKDIANNIRAVITVASDYASDVLPDQACKLVRQCLLSLPECYAAKLASLQLDEHDSGPAANDQVATIANARGEQAATKILTLAVESLDIIRKVAQVIGDVVDRADWWAQRLRLVQSQGENASPSKLGPPPPSMDTHKHPASLTSSHSEAKAPSADPDLDHHLSKRSRFSSNVSTYENTTR